MTLHREGRGIIAGTAVLTSGLTAITFALTTLVWIEYSVAALMLLLLIAVVQFFRVPKRVVPTTDENAVLCPSDGKVVVIEEVEETEFLNGPARQISIFMSPLNVHVNWYPIIGEVVYTKYHPGKYLVAWHPKSSTENERTTVVSQSSNGKKVLYRQIAGAVARRICLYAKEGYKNKSGEQFGFIKFGSRIDVFLPLDAKIDVKIGQKVKGIETILGYL